MVIAGCLQVLASRSAAKRAHRSMTCAPRGNKKVASPQGWYISLLRFFFGIGMVGHANAITTQCSSHKRCTAPNLPARAGTHQGFCTLAKPLYACELSDPGHRGRIISVFQVVARWASEHKRCALISCIGCAKGDCVRGM